MIDRDLAFRYLTGALTGGAQPEAVGRKFTPEGTPLPCPGNTIICHIDQRSEAFAGLVTAQQHLKTGPHADAFTFLPAESFHMTVFEGVIDYTRTPERWPTHLPLDAPIDTVTTDFAERLQDINLPAPLQVRPEGIFAGFSVSLTGATPEAETRLRHTRDQFQTATNLIRPDHDTYRFHITLGYLLRWLDPTEANAVLDLSEDIAAKFTKTAGQINLGTPEFCRFDTMHHFERICYLNT
ncbi:DUF1868 domain-containing protein [Halovulum sp. GXIMD14793]